MRGLYDRDQCWVLGASCFVLRAACCVLRAACWNNLQRFHGRGLQILPWVPSWLASEAARLVHVNGSMGIQTHRDLRAWRLANEVRVKFIALVRRPAIRSDRDFVSQALRAANGACRNIAEGFGRYTHTEFGRFVVIARGSLFELLDSLDEAEAKGYVEPTERTELEANVMAAIRCTSALRSYLQRPKH
jgi:four helix bundle protein